MATPGTRLGVAVSGGADSVCLLHALREIGDWPLTVLHLNHKLRGEESDTDAEFVRALASGLGLPAVIREADVAGAGGNLEQAGREARRTFFREVIAAGMADRVALGHTRSDQAETVLYRFLRGAGSAGLAGIRPVTPDGLIRPLIEITREEVEAFLRGRAMVWREDSTNTSRAFARNRIRHDLLPQLAREWNPAIDETLATTAEWALAEETFWDAEISRLASGRLIENDGAVLLRVDSLSDLPMAAARRLLRRAMKGVKGDLRGVDFRHVDAVLELASLPQGRGRRQAAGVEVRRSFEWLRFSRADEPGAGSYRIDVSPPASVTIPGAGSALCFEVIDMPGVTGSPETIYNEGAGWLDWCSVSGRLELRNWQPGDQYQPLASAGPKKLKALFQQARIPAWERRRWPILTDGASILWTRRFGPASRFAANAATRTVLVVREIQGCR
jgi:tRNA(Ile)-lysidine synthase